MTWAYWREVSKCDKAAREFARTHYSRAKPDSNELGPPGQKIVLMGVDGKALRRGQTRPAWTDSRDIAVLYFATTAGL